MTTRRDFLTRSALTAGAILLPEDLYAQRSRPAQPAPPAQPVQPGKPEGAPSTAAKCCIMIDAVTGKPFYEHNADERRAVASTQKLVSALVIAGQSRNNLKQTTIVQPGDTRVEPTKLFIKAGETYEWSTLFNAMLVKSCNDCAHCLGRTVGGTDAGFASLMNQYAARLGMKNSHFMNASGLPANGQFSTARDMARAARAAIYNPLIRSAVAGRGHHHPSGRTHQPTNEYELSAAADECELHPNLHRHENRIHQCRREMSHRQCQLPRSRHHLRHAGQQLPHHLEGNPRPASLGHGFD